MYEYYLLYKEETEEKKQIKYDTDSGCQSVRGEKEKKEEEKEE